MRKQAAISAIVLCLATVIFCLAVLAKAENGDDDGESPIDWNKLPAAVQETIKAQLGTEEPETLTREEFDGYVAYEAAQKTKEQLKEVKVADNGHILEVEDNVPISDLPPAVADTVQKEAPGAQIKGACRVTCYFYEVLVTKDNKEREIKVWGNGQEFEEED